jgi:hypothetical protein
MAAANGFSTPLPASQEYGLKLDLNRLIRAAEEAG